MTPGTVHLQPDLEDNYFNESILEPLLHQPFLDLLVVVSFDPDAHGHLVDLRCAVGPCEPLQELLHGPVQRPDVPLHSAQHGGPSVAMGDVRIDGNVVHS